MIITLSDFTKDAQREGAESDRSPISLINGESLIDLMIEHEVGVVRRSTTILQIDEGALSEQLAENPESVDHSNDAVVVMIRARRDPPASARTGRG